MIRVALYARYSSDNQRDASIEDQFRICREQAKREKWKIVGTYKDAGISGASMILRPGIQALLQDAQAGQFDIVLAEALDGACAVPLDIMDACCEGIRLAADYAEKGSVLAVSDAGCAALFCKAALQASALNVAINTKLMTDRAHAAALDEKAARMLAEYVPLADEVYQSVASRLRA